MRVTVAASRPCASYSATTPSGAVSRLNAAANGVTLRASLPDGTLAAAEPGRHAQVPQRSLDAPADAGGNGMPASAPSADSATYQLVLANILATPLKLLAPLLCAHVAPGGHLVLTRMDA